MKLLVFPIYCKWIAAKVDKTLRQNVLALNVLVLNSCAEIKFGNSFINPNFMNQLKNRNNKTYSKTIQFPYFSCICILYVDIVHLFESLYQQRYGWKEYHTVTLPYDHTNVHTYRTWKSFRYVTERGGLSVEMNCVELMCPCFKHRG